MAEDVGFIVRAGVRRRRVSSDVSREEGAIGMAQVSMLPFNKVVEYEGFADPELVVVMRDIFRQEIQHFSPEFPKGAEARKFWEIAMSVRALERFSTHGRTRIFSASRRAPGNHLLPQQSRPHGSRHRSLSGRWGLA
jgi:hypothetical protein